MRNFNKIFIALLWITIVVYSCKKEDDTNENSSPVAEFSANLTNTNTGVVIEFTDLSTNNPTSWFWEFGDGETSTSQNPKYNYLKEGIFNITLTVTNNYGSDKKTINNYITISSSQETSTVVDVDGNIYKTVKIGEQWWMSENLKTTKYNDNTAIPHVNNNSEWNYLSTPAYCWYHDDEANYKDLFGALYNWYVIETEKLCPTDWHIPSDEEWKTLEMHLGMSRLHADDVMYRGNKEGSKLKSLTGWNDDGNGTNKSGFNAIPSGHRYGSTFGGAFFGGGDYARFWTDTKSWYRQLYGNSGKIYRDSGHRSHGFSVRCVKD